MKIEFKNMRNLAMKRKLEKDEAIDLSHCERDGSGNYILPFTGVDFRQGVDYCDAVLENWIWSIGRHKETGQVLASIDARFYQNPAYECLWLR